MALIGLRMMPMFPSSPLKFRTAGFPQYGFKAGFSDRAFPLDAHMLRRLVCFCPSCERLSRDFLRTVSEPLVPFFAPPFERIYRSAPGVLAPVRVILSRSINT